MTSVAIVERARSGDRAALGEIYEEYGDRLYDFCFRLLRNRDAAADAVQDTFVLAAQRLHQLRDPERLRAWLYAIARHVCFRGLARSKREVVLDDVVAVDDETEIVLNAFSEAAAIALVRDAAAGLADRDRLVLELHERHGLDGDELAAAIGVAQSNPYSLVHRARAQLERAVSVLLVARMGRGRCAELDAVLGDWDGSLTPLLRKRIGRHVDNCAACAEVKRNANPLTLLAAIPILLQPKRADAAELGDVTQIAVRFGLSEEQWQADGFPPLLDDGAKGRRRRLLLMWIFGTGVLLAALVVLVTAAGGDASGRDGPKDESRAVTESTAPHASTAPSTRAPVDATVAPVITVAGVSTSVGPTTPTTRATGQAATPTTVAPAPAAPVTAVASPTTVPTSSPPAVPAPVSPGVTTPPTTAPAVTTNTPRQVTTTTEEATPPH
jgi:RNA polymerase sigma factor (sigma-70 family)